MGEPELKVFALLPLVEEVDKLEQICTELELRIPEENVGNRQFIFKLIMKCLTAEEFEKQEDQGVGKLLKVLEILEANPLKEVKVEVAEEAKVEIDDIKSLKLHKLRDFKINGMIGTPGQKDKLSYSSLSYQIQNGRERGFSEKEICSAVIRAITPGSHLRNYLESRDELNLKSLIKVLRSHFKERDATSVFTEMSNAVQLGSENEMDFCMRLMGLRQKVILLSKEEDCPYEVRLVQNRFLHALFTGLKYNNVRHELKNVLKPSSNISDEDLLQEISDIVVNETEHSEKLQLKSTANVNAVEKIEQKVKKEKSPSLLTEINKLSAQVSELSNLKKDIENLRTEVKESKMSSCPPRYNSRARRPLCANCKRHNSSFCNHCFECGATDHKRNDCPSISKEKN